MADSGPAERGNGVRERLLGKPAGGSEQDKGAGIHMRNIETYLGRIHEEMGSGRADSVQEIRSEIRLLARTIAALTDGSGQ